jgi:CheY-like chemotaxis protein/HPt (histidine-containing phosphotransfer) domain-containing protein
MAEPVQLLLAEDDPVSRTFLSEVLSAAGYRVDPFDDGERARRAAAALRYDLLCVDLNLPRLDGATLLAQLRADPAAASRDAPAIALTAAREAAVRGRLLGAGYHAVLDKPVGIDALLAAVEATLGGVPVAGAGAAPSPGCALPDWDDAAALASADGSAEIVHVLRPMLLADLPRQRERTLLALDGGDDVGAAAELHRLRAACGFCGAARLAAAVDGLSAALGQSSRLPTARAAFEQASGRLLATPLPGR